MFAHSSLRLPWLWDGDISDSVAIQRKKMIMKFSGTTARRRVAGVAAGCVLGGATFATIAAPTAAAAPDCTAGGVSNTVSTTLGSARAYLSAHPGANQAVGAAFSQPRPQASATLRDYFTSN